jgi:putative ABC transport system permease protein
VNTLFFAEEPVGTIPYSVVEDLASDSRVKSIIPFSMADYYNGYGIVGTTSEYLFGEYANKKLALGESFDDSKTMQAVVGAKVAERNELKIGDVIYASHSSNELDKHEKGMTVVGILEETHSAFDDIVFTQTKTLWEMHNHGEEEGEQNHSTVCAVIIVATNPGTAMSIVNEYDGKIIQCDDGDSHILQAIEPMSVVRDLLNDVDDTQHIIYVLYATLAMMSLMNVAIIILLKKAF